VNGKEEKKDIFLKMDWNLEPAKKLFHLNTQKKKSTFMLNGSRRVDPIRPIMLNGFYGSRRVTRKIDVWCRVVCGAPTR
jgi:hypothetical protein